MKAQSNNNSKYNVIWVEVKASKGIVTKGDRIAMGQEITVKGNSGDSVMYHFASKEVAEAWILSMQEAKLSKSYECRFITDAQRACDAPFTAKQLADVRYI